MRKINRFPQRVLLIFAFFILICRISVLGNVAELPNASFSITSDNSVNSSGWNLKYPTSENCYKITMLENNREKEFTVRSKFFEVAYVLNKNGFGARMIKSGKGQVPEQILKQILSMEALKQQKVISDPSINDETALKLIASYLPDLINVNYKHLVQ